MKLGHRIFDECDQNSSCECGSKLKASWFFGTGGLLRHSSDEHYATGEVGQAFGSKTRWQATVRRLYIQPGLRSLATHFLSVCLIKYQICLEGMTPYLGELPCLGIRSLKGFLS